MRVALPRRTRPSPRNRIGWPFEEDGTLTLSGLASDEGRKGAESTVLSQGDLER